MASQAEVLQSLRIAQRVAERGNLYADPGFNAALRPPGPLRRAWSTLHLLLGMEVVDERCHLVRDLLPDRDVLVAVETGCPADEIQNSNRTATDSEGHAQQPVKPSSGDDPVLAPDHARVGGQVGGDQPAVGDHHVAKPDVLERDDHPFAWHDRRRGHGETLERPPLARQQVSAQPIMAQLPLRFERERRH